MRPDGRSADELRKINIAGKFMDTGEGSVLIKMGGTRGICTASIENKVPQFLRDQGKGWVTAEYSMFPRATPVRTVREASTGKIGGRTHEIQRLVGRAMRSVVDTAKLGERTVWLDCDVIQADGGTRCASISGSFISLVLALHKIKKDGLIKEMGAGESPWFP